MVVLISCASCAVEAPEESIEPAGASGVAPTIRGDAQETIESSLIRPEGSTVIQFNEVHYHPPRGADLQEFVEIANLGDQRVNLQDWCIKGAGFCWEAATSIEPGEVVVVAFDDDDRRLSNAGESLRLIDALGQRIDELAYTDNDPWPTLADGGGASLQRVAAGAGAASWRAGSPTPGALHTGSNEPVVGDIVVTELYYHPVNDDPAAAFLEIMNVSEHPIDLAGWCLIGTSKCWSQRTVLGRGDVFSTDGWFAEGGLSRAGERIHLMDSAGRIHDTVVFEDHGDWPAIADGYGWSLNRRNLTASGALAGNWDAAIPTPGAHGDLVEGVVRPLFSDVEFSTSPSPNEPIIVSAKIADVDEVRAMYRIGFADEIEVRGELNGGRVQIEIPGLGAGSLIRFRLVGSVGGEDLAHWPRSGDGQLYDGTVVDDPDADVTSISRLQLFAQEDVWQEARSNVRLHGNEGYPVVLAFNGEIIDNALIRIKGNQARTNAKKKWKIMLPAGQHWDAGGLLRAPVDQFDLLPAATDKSFSREILVSDMQELAGGISQQVLPMRVEVNNEFFGLHMYGESPDGDWRSLMGFSDDVYVWKAERLSFLRLRDLDLAADVFPRHYERLTRTWEADDDDLLRDLITTIDTLEGQELENWVLAHVDVPQVVNSLATMRIVQHSEWQHKNYFVAFDPEDARWRLIPIDFDLTFGRFYASPCNARCDAITAWPYLDYPQKNRLARALLQNETFRSMVDRRTRELAEIYLAPGFLEQRLAGLVELMGDDAADDRRRWRAYGSQQSMERAQAAMIRNFIEPKRGMYLGPSSKLPDPQPASPTVDVIDVVVDDEGQVDSATVINLESYAVDLSGMLLSEIDAVMPAGLVLPAGGSCVVVFERVPVLSSQAGELVVRVERMAPEQQR